MGMTPVLRQIGQKTVTPFGVSRGFQILYSSETAKCLFARSIGSSLMENLRFLRAKNDRNVSSPSVAHDYSYGEMVGSMEQIPPPMRAFCSLTNSQWLVNADNRELTRK